MEKKSREKEFYRKLFTLVMPIAFQQVMLALVSASDALMLGRLTQSALSAVSLAGQIAFVQNLFLAAMTIGLSMFVAQYWGKGDVQAVERLFACVLKISVMVSVLFTVAAVYIPECLMHIFTDDAELVGEGVRYLRSVSVSYALTGISQIYLCMMKNTGRAFRSSFISSVSVVLNIVLNAVFIFGLWGVPGMGVAGAATATVIARAVEVIWCIAESAQAGRVKLRWRNLIKDIGGQRQNFWKYTRPVLGNEIVWGIGFSMYSVIMGHLGSDAVAANSIANIVKNLVACFCIGLGSGGSIMVGNELGAGNLQTARVYGKKLCKMSVICGAVSGLVLLMGAPFILAVVHVSGQAYSYLKLMLIMCSYYMIGKSVNGTTIGGIFCAGGDSRFGFWCDLVTMWLVIIPTALLAAFVLKLPVMMVYFIINLDEMVKLPAVYIRYRKYRWVKNLT